MLARLMLLDNFTIKEITSFSVGEKRFGVSLEAKMKRNSDRVGNDSDANNLST